MFQLWEVSKYFRIFHLLLKDLENELDSISQDDVAMDSENYKRSCERINLKQVRNIDEIFKRRRRQHSRILIHILGETDFT